MEIVRYVASGRLVELGLASFGGWLAGWTDHGRAPLQGRGSCVADPGVSE